MSRQLKKPPKLLLTGRPGCGKTSIIMKLAQLWVGKKIAGFYTQEIRSAGQRRGFSVRTFSQTSGLLSSIDCPHGPRLGRYRVDVPGFEKIVLPELTSKTEPVDIFIIDEIGKMECFSPPFVHAVRSLLNGNLPVVATIALKGSGFIAEVKARKDVEIIEVTPANRDQLPQKIAARLFPSP